MPITKTSNKTYRINIRLTEQQGMALEKIAEKRGLGLSELIREQINKIIQEYGKKL